MLNVVRTLPKFNKLYVNKLYVRLLGSSLLTFIGLTMGLVPEVSVRSPDLNESSLITIYRSRNAHAQEFTPEETENYAKAGYQVELLRREVYQEIKNSINQPPPDIVCDRTETLDNLQPEVREIADRYCDRSREIVEQHNLTVDRFNELKTYYDRQDSFYQQVQSILLKLQN